MARLRVRPIEPRYALCDGARAPLAMRAGISRAAAAPWPFRPVGRRCFTGTSCYARAMDEGAPERVREYADQVVAYVRRALGVTLEYDSDTLPLLDHYLRTVPAADAQQSAA